MAHMWGLPLEGYSTGPCIVVQVLVRAPFRSSCGICRRTDFASAVCCCSKLSHELIHPKVFEGRLHHVVPISLARRASCCLQEFMLINIP